MTQSTIIKGLKILIGYVSISLCLAGGVVWASGSEKGDSEYLSDRLSLLNYSKRDLEFELSEIKRIGRELGPISMEDALKLERDLGADYGKLVIKYYATANVQEAEQIKKDLHRAYRLAAAVALKTQGAIEKWDQWVLDNPRLVTMLLEAFTVAAAIGAERTVDGLGPIIGVTMLTVSAVVLPYKYFVRKIKLRRMEKLLGAFYSAAKFHKATTHPDELGYPKELASCKSLLSQAKTVGTNLAAE